MSSFFARTKQIAGVFFLTLLILFAGAPKQVSAVWNGNQYQSGATLNPECAPTEANCAIETIFIKSGNIITFTGHIVPSAVSTFDIGSLSNPVRELFLSSDSISVDGTRLSNSGGILNWAGYAFQLKSNTVNSGELRLTELSTNGSHTVALKAPNDLISNVTLILPDSVGSNNQVLKSNGSGGILWGDLSAAGGAIGQPVSGGTTGGLLFVDSDGKLAQDSRFTYDPIQNKLTFTGIMDPLAYSVSDFSGGAGSYYEAKAGQNAAKSNASEGRIRYNATTQQWEKSENAGNYTSLTGLTAAVTSLNTLTGAVQTFATGNSGSDFAINSSGTTHTFAIPNASSSVSRGLLTNTDWNTFNNKVPPTRQILSSTGLSGGGDLSADRTLSLDINGLTAKSTVNSNDYLPVYDSTIPGTRKITRTDLLQGVLGALQYRGTWNAAANTPTLADLTGVSGDMYAVATAGTQTLGTSNTITVGAGDFVIHNGTKWQVAPSAAAVTSVFTRTGAITAGQDDYTATLIKNVPSGNIASATVQAALNELDLEKLSTALNTNYIFVGNALGAAAGVSMSGDATISNTGALTIAANAVALGTDTTGNYVAGNTAGTGITVTGTAGEAWSPTISLASTVPTSVSNDTNVTGTLASNILTLGWTGQLGIGRGGTNGTVVPTAGAVAYGTGTAYSFTAAGTSGQILTSTGTGSPAWTSPSALGSFILTGSDTGTNQTLTLGDTLTIAAGTGIDTTPNATDTLTVAFDSTEIGTTTWGNGADSTWTFNGSGVTDPTITFGSNSLTATGNFIVQTASPTQDQIAITASATGTARFLGTLTNADLTAARIWTLPDVDGTVYTSGNDPLDTISEWQTLCTNCADIVNDTTGTLTTSRGGTGLTTAPANGQVLIGNGTGYTLATLTGTANQISVAGAAGTITLSTPQNIHSAASPTFAGMTISGLGTGIVHSTSGALSSSQIVNADIAGSTIDLTTKVTGILPVVNGGTGTTTGSITGTGTLAFTAGGVNQNVTLSPSGTGYTILNGNVGIGTTNPGTKLDVSGGSIRTDNQLISTVATGTAPLVVSSPTLVANLNADLLDGHDTSYFQTTLTNPVTGTGTTNYNAYWTSANTLGSEQYVAVSRGGTGTGTLSGLLVGNGTSAFTGVTLSSAIAGVISDETGSGNLVFGTSPTLSSPNIAKIANLISNGFVKTSVGDGTLTIDTNTYLTGNQNIGLSGDVIGSGTTSISTTIADNSVDGTDIALGSDTTGDTMYYNGTDWVRLGGSAGFLKSTGATAPSWSTLTDADVPDTITLTNLTQVTNRDHGALTGLTDDDHTIYALLAGRTGGQTLTGGTGTMDDLTLRTTSGVGAAGADMIFQVGNNGTTEAMRILNSGNVGIGTTNPSYKLDVTGNGTSTWVASIKNSANAEGAHVLRLIGGADAPINPDASDFITFTRPDGTNIGAIQQDTTDSLLFSDTSDQRLKESISDTNLGIDTLKNIQVRDFVYKADPTKTRKQGFIAQELYTVYPQAVSVGSSDAKVNPWGVDYGKLTPLLVKSVQELADRTQSLKIDNSQSIFTGTVFASNVVGLSQPTPILATDILDVLQKASAVKLGGSLFVQGESTFEGIVTLINQATFKNSVNFQADVNFTKAVVFDNNVLFKSRLTFEDQDMAGYVKIATGKTEVKIAFEKKYNTTPIIQITPLGRYDTKYWVTEVTTDGFMVKIDPSLAEEAQFSWTALAVKNPRTIKSETSQSAPTPLYPTGTVDQAPTVSLSPSPEVSPSPSPSPLPTAAESTPTPTIMPETTIEQPSPAPVPEDLNSEGENR